MMEWFTLLFQNIPNSECRHRYYNYLFYLQNSILFISKGTRLVAFKGKGCAKYLVISNISNFSNTTLCDFFEIPFMPFPCNGFCLFWAIYLVFNLKSAKVHYYYTSFPIPFISRSLDHTNFQVQQRHSVRYCKQSIDYPGYLNSDKLFLIRASNIVNPSGIRTSVCSYLKMEQCLKLPGHHGRFELCVILQ